MGELINFKGSFIREKDYRAGVLGRTRISGEHPVYYHKVRVIPVYSCSFLTIKWILEIIFCLCCHLTIMLI